LPNLEPESLEEVKAQLAASFGQGEVTLKPNREEKSVAVKVSLTDGTQFSGEIKVNSNMGVEASEEQEKEQEIMLKFVLLPISSPRLPVKAR
jgi:hypothetical protein